MEIPFADAVFNRLSRREAALDLVEAVEDEVVDSVGAVDLPATEPALLLQKMENQLDRHRLAVPDVLGGGELRKLRYILNFARLADQGRRYALRPASRWDPRHLWLVPIAQAVQLQMVRNAPYADHLVRFAPTLSPANLAPSPESIDRARAWGRKSVDKAIPVTTALLQPTWREGHRPAAPGAEPDARPTSVASPMSAVMAAIREPQNRLARWRSRRLT